MAREGVTAATGVACESRHCAAKNEVRSQTGLARQRRRRLLVSRRVLAAALLQRALRGRAHSAAPRVLDQRRPLVLNHKSAMCANCRHGQMGGALERRSRENPWRRPLRAIVCTCSSGRRMRSGKDKKEGRRWKKGRRNVRREKRRALRLALALARARHDASSFSEFGSPHRAFFTQQRYMSA